jgi:hypothetical protein
MNPRIAGLFRAFSGLTSSRLLHLVRIFLKKSTWQMRLYLKPILKMLSPRATHARPQIECYLFTVRQENRVGFILRQSAGDDRRPLTRLTTGSQQGQQRAGESNGQNGLRPRDGPHGLL